MIKNFKVRKRIISLVLIGSILGTGVSLKLHKDLEVKRVSSYLEDLKSPYGYVDMTRVDKDYNIKPFNGSYLKEALEDSDVSYVRIADNFIYDGSHVTPFKYELGFDYDNILGIDRDGNTIYDSVNPINMGDGTCSVPSGYQKELISEVHTTPVRYDDLDNRCVDVVEYPEYKSLVLKKLK